MHPGHIRCTGLAVVALGNAMRLYGKVLLFWHSCMHVRLTQPQLTMAYLAYMGACLAGASRAICMQSGSARVPFLFGLHIVGAMWGD